MTGEELQDEHHVARYVKPSLVDGSEIDAAAFVLRPGETGLSVNWLEYFGGGDRQRQVEGVRRTLRLNLSRNGRFATLNVGETKQHVSRGAREAGFSFTPFVVKAPRSSTVEFPADPSHAEIKGLPLSHSEAAMLIGDLMSECVQAPLFPGKTSEG